MLAFVRDGKLHKLEPTKLLMHSILENFAKKVSQKEVPHDS